MQRTYLIGGNPVGIRTTSRAFGAWMEAALGTHAVPGWDGADYSLVVHDPDACAERGRRDFSVLYRGTAPVIRTFDLPMLGRSLITELSSLLAAERDEAILLALPALVSRDAAVLVSPRIAAAVGELGRRAERAGIGLPAATFSAVDPASGNIVPLCPLLDTPAESWHILESLGPQAARDGPRLLTGPVRVDAVCLSARDAAATPRPRSRLATLETLLASTSNFRSVGAAGVDGLARLVEGARCYDLGRTDARQTLSALTTIIGLVGDSPRQ